MEDTSKSTSASESMLASSSGIDNDMADELSESTEDLLLENLSITITQKIDEKNGEIQNGQLQLGYFVPIQKNLSPKLVRR